MKSCVKGASMKTHVVDRPGGPFHEVDIAIPEPASHEVLVRICASGINPLDTKIRAGQGGHARQPLPAVLGLTWRVWSLRSVPESRTFTRVMRSSAW